MIGLSSMAANTALAVGKCKTRGQISWLADKIASMWRDGRIGDDEYAFLITLMGLRTSRRDDGLKRFSLARVTAFVPRGRQASPDRAASRARKRMLGGSNALPKGLSKLFPEGTRAVLAVVASEIKRDGFCTAPIDRIAAIAGVCRTTVQTALHEARRLGLIAITARPRKGRKNLTNVIEIVSREWQRWIDRGIAMARAIGSKIVNFGNPTQTSLFTKEGKQDVCDHALGAGKRCETCRQRRYCEGEARKLGRL